MKNKKIIYSILYLLLLITSFSCEKIVKKKKEFTQKREVGTKPFEDFFSIRDYPNMTPDIAAYKQVVNSEMQKMTNERSSSSVSWQMEGPLNIGGRINSIAIHPSSLNTIIIGTPNGGIFKSINDGATWQAVFDNEITSAIGDIVYAPSNSQIVFAGTGDPALGGYSFIGNGIYKSIDGGDTWSNSGLTNTGVISKIQVHPTNPNIIYVAAMGIKMIRSNDRGIYKSIDGGATWNLIKFINNETGFNNILINPVNPSILYATSWSRVRNNEVSIISGYTSRLHKSIDAGLTWNQLSNGLPNINLSKWNMCMSKQNPEKLYVSLIDSTLEFNSAYVTTNGGNSFIPLSSNGLNSPFRNFGWYFGGLTINPTNDNDFLLGGVDLWRTRDGGNNFVLAAPEWFLYIVHADHHDVEWISNNTFYLCTDGGLYKTIDGGINYFHYKNLPINQFYRTSINPNALNDYWAGAQDNGTTNGNAANIANWSRVYGGDGFQQRFNPTNSLEFFTETQNGGIVSTNDGGMNWFNGDNNIDPSDRRNWDMPYIMSSFDPEILYTGTYRIYKNNTGVFTNWIPISNDLTDGIIFAPRFHNISAIDHSTLNSKKIVAGTSDANVWYTNNDGTTWNNITSTLPTRYVTSVKCSPNDANTMYVTHSGYLYNSFIPHIHKSIDNGLNWIDISSNLPQFAINDLYIGIGHENDLFVATDGGIYYTNTSGTTWQRLGNNMPLIPVYDIEYDEYNNKLIAGTFGRSVQSIDLTGITSGVAKPFVKDNLAITVFPIPFENNLTLVCNQALNNALIYIYDLNGKLVYTTKQSLQEREAFNLNLDLKPGSYILHIKEGNSSFSKKIMKF